MSAEWWAPLPPEAQRCFLYNLELVRKTSDESTRYYEKARELKLKVGELEKKVLDLEKQLVIKQLELEAARRAEKRQAAPFSKGPPKLHPRKPGRPVGHPPARRAVPERVDELMEIPLCSCPHCHGEVTPDREEEQFIEDLLIRPHVRRLVFQTGFCTHCKRRVRHSHPAQLSTAVGAAKVQIGEAALSLAAELKHRLGVPYRKIVDLFQSQFGLKLTAGALVQAGQRLTERLTPVHESVLEALRSSSVCHTDETGWKVGGTNAWLWVFTNQDHTAYVVSKGRGQDVVRQTLGDNYKGVLVTDCYSAYDSLAWAKSKCLGHIIHEMSEIIAAKKGPARRFLRDALSIFRRAIALKPRKKILKPSVYAAQATRVEKELNGLLLGNYTDPDNARLAKRFRKQRPHLLRFLYHDEVEPTNNHAERSIRPAVIARKISGCNRTESGVLSHEVLTSLVVTCRQQNVSFADLVRSALTRFPDFPLHRFSTGRSP